jgi:creatinine amidohydrolase
MFIMVTLKKVFLADMTWKEAEDLFKKTNVAIIPMGSQETHGPHNPLGTDTFTTTDLAKRIGEKVDVIISPPIPIGWSQYETDFTGTISFTRQTIETILEEICLCLMKWGIKRFIFLSGHGGNLDAMETVGLRLRMEHGAMCVVPRWFRPEIDNSIPELDEIFPFHDHGGKKETSLNLAINPSRVRTDLYKPSKPGRKLSDKIYLDINGMRFGKGTIGGRFYMGDLSDQGFLEDENQPASEASAEKGEKYLNILSEYLADFVKEFSKLEMLPQDPRRSRALD